MDVESLRLFLRIADLGSVTAAARDLSLSPAAASARLGKFEQTLGFRLFNRTTRAISLTTDGAEFLPYAEQAIETLASGVRAVRGEGAEAQGLLRMTMPGSFGRLHVIPALAEFQKRHPNVSLDIRLSDEVLDVVEGAYDLIIRNAPLQDSTLVARKLARDQRLLVASSDYVERYGAPSSLDELKQHRCVVLAGHAKWKFESGAVVTPTRVLAVNDGEAMRSLTEQGLGISVQSRWIARQHLDDGRFIALMTDRPLATESAIWALYPSHRIVAPKVRAMIDFLQDQFQPVPPWER
ncbi:MAG: LysR family transcriptional regulator [Pseudomonadota bacterium]